MATKLDLKAKISATVQGQPYGLSLPELPEGAGLLSEPLQVIARQYIGARRRSGAALLEMCQWLHEARQIASHGEWKIFKEATGTSDDTAERLLNIHIRAAQDSQFAEAIARDWLSQSAAALLARPSTPPELVDQALSAPEPPTKRQIESSIRGTKIRTGADFADPIPPVAPALSPDQQHMADVERILRAAAGKGELTGSALYQEAYGHARQIGDVSLYNRAFAMIDRAVEGSAPTPTAPFWQSMSPTHPTAHLWTRTGMNEHHAACGMTTQRVPSGSKDAGHCSSCTRATWPKSAAPDPAHTERLEEQIEVDRIPEASMQIAPPAPLRRPRRPVSADSSAIMDYIDQIEAYATALEDVVRRLTR